MAMLGLRRPEAIAVHAGDPAALPVLGGAWCSNMRATTTTHSPSPLFTILVGFRGATSGAPREWRSRVPLPFA